MMIDATQWCATEWSFSSTKTYADPFHDLQLDVIVSDPRGNERRMPAFWAGGQAWKVRYAPAQPGRYHYRTICSDASNADLHDQTGVLEVTPYHGANSLLQHGPLRVAADHRHLEHADGTPFFWLGDTWWMGFCERLRWPEEFQSLTADRVAKGFTVVQIVAGLYPDMDPFDARGRNEAGFPWTPGFERINPAYWDMVDRRVAHLVEAGITPCLVGSWGFFLEFAGLEVLKQHWRNLVARYAAYPVVWCVAGEALMPFYLNHKEPHELERWQAATHAAWSEMIRTIHGLDPAGRLITIHPTQFGRQQVDQPALLDFEMLQTGHGGYTTLTNTVNMLEQSLAAEPKMPVLVDEVNYEGIVESSREEMQRFLFWSSLLSGAAGHTYGANGLWQVNRSGQPYGPSPHGTSWGDLPWDEAAQLPGARQLGLGKALLMRYPWQRFEPHPEWVTPHQSAEKRVSVYAAGIPSQVRVIFIPAEEVWTVWRGQATIRALEAGVTYHAFYFNPKTGAETDLGIVQVDSTESYVLPKPPIFQDWVLVLERQAV
jgi:hypothetical protein